jgi:hypothetical protein
LNNYFALSRHRIAVPSRESKRRPPEGRSGHIIYFTDVKASDIIRRVGLGAFGWLRSNITNVNRKRREKPEWKR